MNDLKFAIRQLLRSPGFACIAILTLALGIGANATIVTMIDALAFKQVKARDPKQLIGVFQYRRDHPDDYQFFSFADFKDLRTDKTAWSDLGAFTVASVAVREGEYLRSLPAQIVSANYFSILGVAPLLGRAFVEEEETKPILSMILTYPEWQRRGGRADVIGSNLRLSVGDATIIGVMPPDFTGTDLSGPAFFLPAGAAEAIWSRPGQRQEQLGDRGRRSFMTFARLKEGIRLDTAVAGLKVVSDRFRVSDPKEPAGRELVAMPLQRFAFSNRPSRFVKQIVPIASFALGLAVIVLGVACLNLANMLMARGAARRKEIAVRLALGASRQRILRQLLCEGTLLALIGAASGLLIAVWSTSALSAFLNAGLGSESIRFDATPDLFVVGALLALAALATVFFALGPAWKLASLDVNSDLKQHGAADTSDRRGFSLKSALVVGQLALSLALLAVAGLFTRSAVEAMHVDPGFAFGQHFVARIDTGLMQYPEARSRQIFDQAEERVATIPGVEAVSLANYVPFGSESQSHDVRAGSANAASDDALASRVNARHVVVSADYFRAMGLAMLRGREFSPGEANGSSKSPVVIISEKLAHSLWQSENPIGRELAFPSDNPTNALVFQVVGVAPDIVWDLFEKQNNGVVFIPRGQEFAASMRLHVRVMPNADSGAIMDAVRKTLLQIDPQMPITEIRTLKGMHAESISVRITKIGAMLFGSFGALALFLSFLGVYGLKAYNVARRTREIGIRMALGATARDVLTMIVTEGARLAAIGLGLGLILAIALGKVTARFLFGVTGGDPITFAIILVVLAAAALIACWIPARRATRVNPMAALRCE